MKYLDCIGDIYDDYKILRFTERKYNHYYYDIECQKCGHIKNISGENMNKQDNHCTSLNCGYDHFKNYIGNEYGDYIYESIEKRKGYLALMKCKYCNHTIKVTESVLKTSSFVHSPQKCLGDYYQTEVGKVYGDYEIISIGDYIGIEKSVNCKCIKCGIITNKKLRSVKKYNFKHGVECLKSIPDSDIKTVIVQRFANMNQRCNNPNNINYSHYGKRNIKLEYDYAVDLYLDFVDEFIRLKEEGKNIYDYSFDRIDVNDNYRKDNLRLVTQSIQSTNTTRKRIFIVEKNGEKILSDNSMELGRYLNINGRSLGNVIRGSSKSSSGWKLVRELKPDENIDSVMKNENITKALLTTFEIETLPYAKEFLI